MPLSISVDNNNLVIKRPIKSKIIPISEINSVSLTPPTMGERRICASGGFFGYWGWFKERELGKYFAYYGKASDCFFVKLSNGRNYMIGCEDPQQITSFLQKRMEK